MLRAAAEEYHMNPVPRIVLYAAIVAAASACVTINIYFPAAAAEKAADRIIEEVWQLREGDTPALKPQPDEESK